jgi:hypothetical protein
MLVDGSLQMLQGNVAVSVIVFRYFAAGLGAAGRAGAGRVMVPRQRWAS